MFSVIFLQIQDDGKRQIELKPGFLMEHDHDVGAVVVGFDRYFNYYKIQ
jgi:phosphoglycolate phosphatase